MKKDNTTLESRKTSKTALVVSFVVIGCLLLAWLVKPSLMMNHPGSGTAAPDLEVTKAQIEAMLQEHTSEYQRRNRQLLEEFAEQVRSLGKEDFDQARKNISPFLKKISTVKFCGKMCYRMAADKFNGTSTAVELLAPELTPSIIVPCARGQEKLQDALYDFLLRLQENDTQYRAGLVELAKSEEFQTSGLTAPDAFWTDINSLTEKIAENAICTIFTDFGVGMEVLFIRSTQRAISKLMAPMVAKITASLAVGGGAAAADGPLPIGDSIGGGFAAVGLAWTGYDLYKLTCVLPKELRQKVAKTIDNAENGMRADVLQYATKMVKQCEENSGNLVSAVVK